jgi:uncharacterized protein (DUF2147 family)
MKFIFSFVLIFLFSVTLKAQKADDIIGNWKNGEGTGIIQIYKTKTSHYAGKIIWLKEPIDPETGKPKLDKRNPDKSKQLTPTLGLVNIWGFIFDEDDKMWIDGTIYDPKTGKEYSCKAEMKKNNVLEVRGYIGVSIFGRTDTWTRMVKK